MDEVIPRYRWRQRHNVPEDEPPHTPLVVDKKTFLRRASLLYLRWENPTKEEELKGLEGCRMIVVVSGVVILQDPAIPYWHSKSLALQHWLFECHLPDSLIVLTRDAIYVLSSLRHHNFLRPLESGSSDGIVPPVRLIEDSGTADRFEPVLELIQSTQDCGMCVGVFDDIYEDEFARLWYASLDQYFSSTKDVSHEFAYIMATRDKSEVECMKRSAYLLQHLYWAELLVSVANSLLTPSSQPRARRGPTHTDFADNVQAVLRGERYFYCVRFERRELDEMNTVYPTIVQSGGHFDLANYHTDERELHTGSGVVLLSLGLRYQLYCTNLVRTLLHKPSTAQKRHYEFLLRLEDSLIESLRPGVHFEDIHAKALSLVQEYDPKLVGHFVKSCGHVMGIEFRETSLELKRGNRSVVRKDMCFNFLVGFERMLNEEAQEGEIKEYVLYLGDTILVKGDRTVALTNFGRELQHTLINAHWCAPSRAMIAASRPLA